MGGRVRLGRMAETFAFVFDSRYAPLLRVGGITPERTSLELDAHELRIRFGLLTLTTPRSNIREASLTGPHQPLKAIGVRMSLTDRGLTFGTSVERTVCMLFNQPVRTKPFDIASHPGLTVSVERPHELVAQLNGSA